MSASPQQTAVLLPPSNSGLIEAGERLRSGGLVAFPTETVYGLGANALDEAAVRSIFTTKGRPLTDPLIVHVPTQEEALQLLELEPAAAIIYELLATAFWPGPLTLVGKAVAKIPLSVTAGTGYVGIRCPNHDLAQRLLVEARVPVAAPSANRFGHVSPTTAQHVYNDLGSHNIAILDGERAAASTKEEEQDVEQEGEQEAEQEVCRDNSRRRNGTRAVTCKIGIESTVAKVDGETKTIIIFRRGGISETAIRECLKGTDYTVQALNKQVLHDPSHVPVDGSGTAGDEEQQETVSMADHGEQAPGQGLTHYAPDVATSLVCDVGAGAESPTACESGTAEPCATPLKDCIVIDFGGHLLRFKNHVLGYRDLSTTSNVSEAAHQLFDTLRWTESVTGAKQVLLVDICQVESLRSPEHPLQNVEHLNAVADRMFRAASGHRVYLDSTF